MIQQVLTEHQSPYALITIPTIVEATSFLYRQGQYADVESPALIIIDMTLTGATGKQLLANLKDEDSLRRIPVIALSSSIQPADVWESYQSRCNCYVVSPHDSSQFKTTVQAIESFWLNIVTLPKG